MLRDGAGSILIGALLIAAARLIWRTLQGRDGIAVHVVVSLLMLPGLSMILHFGIFKIVTAGWRYAGFDCRPLFRAPFLSVSLTEFWGKRWNLAFSQMSAIGVYRPLSSRTGARAAALAAFLFSGLLHEAAISLPVWAGFGLPMLYFLLHGGLVAVESRLAVNGRPIDAVPWRGRLWTAFWLIAPAPILFHPWFLRGIVWPLIGAR